MNQSSLDKIIQDEMDRGEAAQTLKEIASRFPDLFEKVAKAFFEEKDREFVDLFSVRKLSPTQAVLNWIEKHREGTSAEIIADLADKIETTSDKPGSIIHSTLASLEKRGKIQSKIRGNGDKVFVHPDY